MKVIVTRHVSREEPHNFLDRDVNSGEIFYIFRGTTYGSVNTNGGVALSEMENKNPFFEFPNDAIRELEE